ncbi:hypothetical protein SBA1_910012 [Candidatus Sulfotelmatobacter kueseliae]|uniref:Uncharacterized protein n=1 Tax=Candidatus Sulfotelmatobacter kueseliae TaxID=2042962 RepID=A0A2U3LC00_9BACT|nr:hypothetical protein SBA1_910012 [Candidatus Sulfotelmatobacter kueseliae]
MANFSTRIKPPVGLKPVNICRRFSPDSCYNETSFQSI